MNSQPLVYPCLPASTTPFTEEHGVVLGWTQAQVAVANELRGRVDTARERLQGVAGYLATNSVFCGEVKELRDQWSALPANQQMVFPLRRAVTVPTSTTIPLGSELPEEVSAFVKKVHEFLNRWGLIALYAWHLPDPQGPFLPSSLPSGSQAEPQHGIRIILPLHYPLQGDDDLLRRIKDLQNAEVLRLNLPTSMGPIQHHEQYAQILKFQHLETVLNSRFPVSKPRGFVTHFLAIAADELQLSEASLKRLRTGIRTLRRNQVPRFLQPRQ